MPEEPFTEYVITAGEGVMLAHGILAPYERLPLKPRPGEIAMMSPLPIGEGASQRFH